MNEHRRVAPASPPPPSAPAAPAAQSNSPGARPASPVAAYIVAQVARRGWSQRELARRLGMSPSALSRLLSGASRWSRRAPVAFADALELSDAERTRFLALCERSYPRLPRPSPEARQSDTAESGAATGTLGSRAGRRARTATSAIGALIEPLLRQRGMTRSELAQALGVKASTVTRIMSGAHTSTYAVSPQRVADAFHLEGITRRAFVSQALALGVFALASGSLAPPALRYHAFDLEQFDEHLRAAQRLLDAGEPARALAESHALFDAALAAPFPRTHRAAAIRRVEAALMLGRAQEAALPWGLTRALPTIQTYNTIAAETLNWFPVSQMAEYYVKLNERRAPLYRELGEYAESIRQFRHAIEDCMPYAHDHTLLITLYRNRAHVWAVQGREREWRLDLDRAADTASRAPLAVRSRLEGLILYSEAEGFKRLAGVARTPTRQRAYAEAALHSFAQARAQTTTENEGHHVLLDVSEAQAYLWLDAGESARLAQAARARAQLAYPSLESKIELTLAQAAAQSRGARGAR